MKITNFRYNVTVGDNPLAEIHHAMVDVTTGIWPFRKKITRTIFRGSYVLMWRWRGTGAYTPGFVVEGLEKAWTAETGVKLR